MVPMLSTIRQLDVVRSPFRAGREDKPYFVCVQHHLLDHLTTRIMAPLVPWHAVQGLPRLYPAIRVDAQMLFLDPTDLLALPVRVLRSPIANLEADRDRIVAALDLVFTGI